ncbi:MAG: hypothetical protein F4Z57_02095 [Gemmatimonadetes bacterium]|nr:hypothetical protein [Gemmatimonadota bacterium]MYC72722.1 hypothetical protein [Gemmatimonadota bacterium]MYI62795.1 hypothetical protein [Gemmatimonadota bacterium]
MTDMSFDDFVNQQIAKEEPSIDWIQVRDDWKKHLDEFYQLVEGFLQKYTNQGKVHITRATKQITEEHIGSYDVKSLEVQIGTIKVRLDPIGRRVLGVKGRVDMHGPHGTVKFVLVPKTDSSPTILVIQEASSEVKDEPEPVIKELAWKILTPPPNIKYIELEEESFLSAIMEVANA